MTLGQWLKSYREQHNLTKCETAKRAGISYNYIYLLEKEGSTLSPSLHMIVNIARMAGIKPGELVDLIA